MFEDFVNSIIDERIQKLIEKGYCRTIFDPFQRDLILFVTDKAYESEGAKKPTNITFADYLSVN